MGWFVRRFAGVLHGRLLLWPNLKSVWDFGCADLGRTLVSFGLRALGWQVPASEIGGYIVQRERESAMMKD